MNIFTQKDLLIVRSLIILFAINLSIAYLCALFGIFYISLIFVLCVISIIILTKKKLLSFPVPSKNFLLLLVSLFVISIALASIAVPTVFTGRDQGSLSNAAYALAQNHHVQFRTAESDIFFAHYGPGKALHFPGFFYTPTGALTTQFPLPTIAYFGSFVASLGLNGIIIAQSILFFFLGIIAVTLGDFYLSKRGLFVFCVILFTSPILLYFSLFTLSENVADVLFFSSILLLIYYKKQSDHVTLFALFLLIPLLALTRIEGLLLAPLFYFVLLRYTHLRDFLRTQHHLLLPLYFASLVTIGLTALFVSFPFYATMIKEFLSHIPSSLTLDSTHTSPPFFILRALYTFQLLIPLLLMLTYVIIILTKKETLRNTLLPLVVSFPLFFYLISPQITLDVPWMMRRFVFVIMPLLILYSALLYDTLTITRRWKILLNLIVIILVIGNIYTTALLLHPVDHATLLPQTRQLAQRFAPQDLILLSPSVSGDHFAMLGGPLRHLYNRHAVYFFNENDLDIIPTNVFEHIYFIVAQQDREKYPTLLRNRTPQDDFTLTTTFRPPQKSPPFSLTQQSTRTVNYIYQLR